MLAPSDNLARPVLGSRMAFGHMLGLAKHGGAKNLDMSVIGPT